MKAIILFIISFFPFINIGQTIFTESIGSVGGTTSIAAHETANGFDNDSYTMSGSGDIRTSTPSSGYAGASGVANVFLTSSGTASFQIAGINTTSCSSLSLSFGAHKSTTASNMSELLLEYSIDGSSYNTISIPAQPTGSGTAIWRLITVSLPLGAENQSNLRLRWTNTSTIPQFRIDDIGLIGSCNLPNTITTTTITGAPFNVDCSASASGTVEFTSTDVFNGGNIYTAQLSNASGSFASPTAIGTLSSTANSGTINITIPAGTASGSAYRIRVISSSPSITGSDNGTDFSITLNPCTITTGTVTGAPFAVDCTNSVAGSVDFTSVGTYNAGNIYTAQLSNATGSFASPTAIGTLSSTANSGTINITIPAGTASGSGYRIRVISSNPAITGSDNGTDLSITLTPCTITTGTVSGAPFSVNCNLSTDGVGTVDFTSTGIFGAGNIYTAQLSSATGSFATPTIIGTLSSTANSGTINITISSSTSSGSGYRIRVVSSDPVLTGADNGSDLAITQSGPCLPTLPSAGLLINEFSNGANGDKEYYEFVVAGRCGELVDIRGFIIDDNNGTFSTVFPLSGSGIAPGHLKLSNDPQWQSIPVGSLIVVYNAGDPNASLPADDINDSNNDSLYVIPNNNTTLFNITTELPSNTIPDSTYSPIGSYASTAWSPLSLANTGDAVQVRSPNGDYFHGVSYGGNEITGGPNNMKIQNSGMSGQCGWFNDGDIYNVSNWSSGTISGNETPGLPNNAANLAWLRLMRDPNAATCPVIVLPSIAINLEGKYENGQSIIEWKTSSEQNNSHFTISHSTNAKQFSPIGTTAGAGNSSELIQYRFIHAFPHPGINYYKLHSTDYDGTTYYKGIVAINAEFNFTFYNTITSTIELHYESDIEIYSPDGKLIQTVFETMSVPFHKSGLFFILDKRSGIMERLFIP